MFHVLLKEKAGLPRKAAPVQFGVPFPKGLFFNHKELSAVTEDGTALPSDIKPTILWPDNSIKWCLVKTQVDLSANENLKLLINKHLQKYDSSQCSSGYITETDTELQIKTQKHLFEVNKNRFSFIQKVVHQNQVIVDNGYCALISKDHGCIEPKISSFRYHTSTSSDCPLSSEVSVLGTFRSQTGETVANFEAALTFYIDTDRVRCDFTVHNPKPALHPDGLWDLGDPNSLMFTSLDIGISLNDLKAVCWKAGKESKWKQLEQQALCIYQESSGGENWNSPNHKDRNNRVPYSLKGYECRNGSSVIQAGERASPGFKLNTDSGIISVYIENFWQNCPKSLSIDNDHVNIGLFPEQFPEDFELQPGEKKTHTFYLDFSNKPDSIEQLEAPIDITLNPAWVEQSRVFFYFDIDTSDDPLHKIINEGLTGNNNFYAKREMIDEYGWRNFGDLYADHETEGYDGDEIFISHYNNQYDPIYGFIRQFALTGNHKWFELADDLARHVIDIDIYHSQEDRDEYSGGLFWHTDHYLDAATSSHRSYSKYQKSDAYVDHAGGGGPAGEHCYTTGLLYHFLLTGDESSRRAVLGLSDWVTKFYEGSGTLLDVLLSIKNRNQPGFKSVSTGKYSIDRGVGNYINSLLDRFALTQEQTILYLVENIITNTVHPSDDVASKAFDDVEDNWFYTVFFQALCRYLQTKEERSDLDDTFYYVRDSLLQYADWMAANEYPYLQKPEILEFPNHTWTAQDLRKVNILLFAHYYSSGTSSSYLSAARQLNDYITEHLPTEETRTYTRILSILMQNHGAISFFDKPGRHVEFKAARKDWPNIKISKFTAVMNITAALIKAIKNLSPRQELLWLSRRSDRIAKLAKGRL